MIAVELFHKDGHSSGVFYCATCRIVHRTKELADECCMPSVCKKCGQQYKRYSYCEPCWKAEQVEKERARFEKAEKLTEWDGWVYCDHIGHNNGYFESVDALLEYLEYEEDENVPAYCWACSEDHFVHADVSDITERMADSAWEDWEPDSLNGLDELQKALDVFNTVNAHVCAYNPDYSKAVLLRKESA